MYILLHAGGGVYLIGVSGWRGGGGRLLGGEGARGRGRISCSALCLYNETFNLNGKQQTNEIKRNINKAKYWKIKL